MTKLDAVGSSIKLQILQTAMLHSEVGAFDFNAAGEQFNRQPPTKSTEYVALVLGTFMRGVGQRVPDAYTVGPASNGYQQRTKEDTAARQLAFREQLGTQIHSLTGKKPRWAVQTDGAYAIFPE